MRYRLMAEIRIRAMEIWQETIGLPTWAVMEINMTTVAPKKI
jgi:hypothetical protein